ncbi:S1 family peptidase [bacterium]|nr:S1 family peptidase [bacterium]
MLSRDSFILLLPLLMACTAQHKTVEKAPAPKPTTVSARPVDITVPMHVVPAQEMQADSLTTWASSIQLICNAKTCPPQVGLLVFVSRQNNMTYFTRCTASLIAANKIITNGHCDKHENNEGYFITQKINGKHRHIKIKDLEFKQFDESKKNSQGEIDVAIFSLQQSVDSKEIKPFQLPQENTPDFQKMYAYVINQGADEKTFVIDEKVCTPQRHEVLFPFDFSENPDTFSILNCEIIPGNSGAPILASRMSTTVEALVVGFTSIEMKQAELDRPLFSYEQYQEMNATNLRCANIADGQSVVPNCVRTNYEEINHRINDYFQKSFSLMNERELKDASQRPLKYESYPYEIKKDLASPNTRFIIYHMPKCRKQRDNPQTILLIIEDVELYYDALARIELKINETKEFQASVVQAYSNDIFALKVPWPSIDGEFLSTPASEQLGAEFNYSIPVCK